MQTSDADRTWGLGSNWNAESVRYTLGRKIPKRPSLDDYDGTFDDGGLSDNNDDFDYED